MSTGGDNKDNIQKGKRQAEMRDGRERTGVGTETPVVIL